MKTSFPRMAQAMITAFLTAAAGGLAYAVFPESPGCAEPQPGKADGILVLWHSYEGYTEDVIDATGRGNIGEFLTGIRVPSPAGAFVGGWGKSWENAAEIVELNSGFKKKLFSILAELVVGE